VDRLMTITRLGFLLGAIAFIGLVVMVWQVLA
jgi:hypothetical protein